VLNAVFVSGDYPPSWSLAAVSAVLKNGDPGVQDNYRGIAVGNVFGKVFSMVLEQRLSAWSELLGLRARGQAGFRRGMGTADQLFVLRHVLSQYKRSNSQLHMCIVDFQKAYDSVRRDLLLAELAQRGVDGPMLSAIAAMYSSVSLCARQAGQLSSEFPSYLGVKQGDPLSPLLFGLFLDGIEGHVLRHAPGTGAQLSGRLVQILLYADDIVLLARTADELQAQLDALHSFCEQKCMTVNVAKTKVMVFNGVSSSC
jgi:hypothetical protein